MLFSVKAKWTTKYQIIKLPKLSNQIIAINLQVQTYAI